MSEIAPPLRPFVKAVNAALDALVKGLGSNAAYLAAVDAWPLLSSPVISWLVKNLIGGIADSLEGVLRSNIDPLIIRLTDNQAKAEYDKVMDEYLHNEHSPDALRAAKDAIDKLVYRGS
jgi:hypothetical protein